ncbi:MAG: phosphopentomutase [Syntrophomonadaceae bacterium]|nr:phosphopentomutase [Syntrophomonadaceae bacterium]
MSKRAILLVLDSVGIGAAEDSCIYGDEACNTLKHTAEAVGGLKVPHMQALGLGCLEALPGVEPTSQPKGAYGKMAERSKGKDTTTGHWEMMGIVLEQPFPTYPHGFPRDVIQELEKRIGRSTLGNVVASGTEIIAQLGQKHLETGFPIIYTSVDSVFQMAAHEEIIPVAELYRMCQIAREILQGPNAVGRVIARPFTGSPGSFVRTPRRHDFSLQPGPNILDSIVASGQKVIGVGKIKDIFAGRSITESYPIENNRDGMQKIVAILQGEFAGMVFANLIDFDMLYGHRNDVQGYAAALEEFDRWLPELYAAMGPEDVVFISADHGCDPTTCGTDHTREQVPVLVYGENIAAGAAIGTRSSFADLGQTVADYLGVETKMYAGQSFLDLIRR